MEIFFAYSISNKYNSFSYLLKKILNNPILDIFSSEDDKGSIFGCYMPRERKILIYLSPDTISIFGNHKYLSIGKILIHELCHMASANNYRKFYEINSNTINRFFFYNLVFLEKFLKEEVGIKGGYVENTYLIDEIKKHSLNLLSLESKEIKEEDSKIINKIIYLWHEFFKKISTTVEFFENSFFLFDRFFKSRFGNDTDKETYMSARYFYTGLVYAYEKLGIKTSAFLGQETLFPSEIVCIQSETKYFLNNIQNTIKIALEE